MVSGGGTPNCDDLFPSGYANISLGLAPCKRFRSLETTTRMVAAFAADFKRAIAIFLLSKSSFDDHSVPPPSATSPALEQRADSLRRLMRNALLAGLTDRFSRRTAFRLSIAATERRTSAETRFELSGRSGTGGNWYPITLRATTT